MGCSAGFVFGGLEGSLGRDLESPLSPDPLMRVGETTRTGRFGRSGLPTAKVFEPSEFSLGK